jgi:4'-phosphopantetheinyl transferase
MTIHSWQPPPERVALAADELHVWALPLDRTEREMADLAAVLTEDENVRAARLKEGPIRDEFVAARGLLRTVLGRYRPLKPIQFRFRHGPTGKPYLADVEPELFFNLSHSNGMALLALSVTCEVGVDVERYRTFRNELGLARRYFLPQEAAGLEALPPESRQRAFFRVWTAKEAILKACGRGLANYLESILLSVEPDAPLQLLTFDGSAQEAQSWGLTHLTPAPAFLGAVAHRSPGCRLVCWRWPDAAAE